VRNLLSTILLLHNLLLILSLNASVVESIHSSVGSTLNASCDSCHSLWILLHRSLLLNLFALIYLIHLVINRLIFIKLVNILIDVHETSTLCRVFRIICFNFTRRWSCAIIAISYVYLFIFFDFVNFLWWVILYFLTVNLVILRWFYFFVHSFSVIIIFFLIKSALLRLHHTFFWLSERWTLILNNSIRANWLSLMLTHNASLSLSGLNHMHPWRRLAGICVYLIFRLIILLRVLAIKGTHVIAPHLDPDSIPLVWNSLLIGHILLHARLKLIGWLLSIVKRVWLDMLTLNLVVNILLL